MASKPAAAFPRQKRYCPAYAQTKWLPWALLGAAPDALAVAWKGLQSGPSARAPPLFPGTVYALVPPYCPMSPPPPRPPASGASASNAERMARREKSSCRSGTGTARLPPRETGQGAGGGGLTRGWCSQSRCPSASGRPEPSQCHRFPCQSVASKIRHTGADLPRQERGLTGHLPAGTGAGLAGAFAPERRQRLVWGAKEHERQKQGAKQAERTAAPPGGFGSYGRQTGQGSEHRG